MGGMSDAVAVAAPGATMWEACPTRWQWRFQEPQCGRHIRYGISGGVRSQTEEGVADTVSVQWRCQKQDRGGVADNVSGVAGARSHIGEACQHVRGVASNNTGWG